LEKSKEARKKITPSKDATNLAWLQVSVLTPPRPTLDNIPHGTELSPYKVFQNINNVHYRECMSRQLGEALKSTKSRKISLTSRVKSSVIASTNLLWRRMEGKGREGNR
jgi:hypothetical protein